RNRVLNFDSPKVMGILNVTPDSFSDGGEYNDPTSALGRIGLMISQGATIIDIGGESTRPGSEPVSEQEELERVVPVLEKAIPQFPDTFFSIDTTKFAVAEKALQLGVHFVNDVSGLKKEPRLAGLCTKYNAAYILMHSQGRPKTMQDNPTYDDVMADINSFFKEKVAIAKQTGLQSIIVDPGIGFGKTLDHNIRILKNLEEFKNLGYPLLIGASRKKMIGELLNGRETSGRLIGTIAVHYHAMLKGANIIRVHDVKEAYDSVLVYNALKK
ncbi:MAG TPA: dihydropteroate synthase, partial [Balneolaceae bacterium]|nr:dihydropteroate synthase [Balneolaceae bacterium]